MKYLQLFVPLSNGFVQYLIVGFIALTNQVTQKLILCKNPRNQHSKTYKISFLLRIKMIVFIVKYKNIS